MLGPKPSAPSAIKTGALADKQSSVNFKQRKRIKGKLKSSSSMSVCAVSVDAERDEDATERRKMSGGTPDSLGVVKSGVKTNTRRHVLISAKRCPDSSSQGPLVCPHITESDLVFLLQYRIKCCIQYTVGF